MEEALRRRVFNELEHFQVQLVLLGEGFPELVSHEDFSAKILHKVLFQSFR